MPSIAQIAISNPNFSILVTALGYVDANVPDSDLVGALSNPAASLTVFAPSNAAFGKLAVDLGFDGDPSDADAVTAFIVGAVDAPTLQTIILYHVAGTALTSGDVAGSSLITTLQGGTIDIDLPTLVDKEPDLLDPSLVATDIMADNGVIHVIDRVLLPIDLPGNDAPTITDIVSASGDGFDDSGADFDILLKAVTTAGLADTLNSDAVDLTVFAPADEAFVNLANALGYGNGDEAGAWGYLVEALTLLGGGDPIPLLTTILTYHVAGESLQASQVLGVSELPTLQGSSLTVDAANLTIGDAEPDLADPGIIATDILASNGIVHAIDGVLIPVDLFADPKSDLVITDDARDRIHTGSGDDYIGTKGGKDYINAGSGNDVVLAGDGNDVVTGRSGNDILFGGADSDRIYGGSGKDQINGDQGNDKLYGGWHDDVINGGEGHDRLSGGFGNDILDGGTGNDKLSGGWGEDTFIFSEGHDRITYFQNGHDVIDLSNTGISDFHELREASHSSWFGTKIYDGDSSLYVNGLSWWKLDESDFIFG